MHIVSLNNIIYFFIFYILLLECKAHEDKKCIFLVNTVFSMPTKALRVKYVYNTSLWLDWQMKEK